MTESTPSERLRKDCDESESYCETMLLGGVPEDMKKGIADIRAVIAENERLRGRVEKLEATLVSRHGGEPLALLSELDEAREENDRLRSALQPFAEEHQYQDSQVYQARYARWLRQGMFRDAAEALGGTAGKGVWG